jgi:ATP-dependent DNA helicase RecG
VPRASRRQRPIYVGENPLGGTQERRNEGDYLLGDDQVRQLPAEQSDTPRDAMVLAHHGTDDLDLEAVAAYRQIFASCAPIHPFIAQSMAEFLSSIEVWKKGRASGLEGVWNADQCCASALAAVPAAVLAGPKTSASA